MLKALYCLCWLGFAAGALIGVCGLAVFIQGMFKPGMTLVGGPIAMAIGGLVAALAAVGGKDVEEGLARARKEVP